MSVKKISKEQPENFEFNSKNLEEAKKIIQNYPDGKKQSAVMALLFLAQRQNNNWIPLIAIKYSLITSKVSSGSHIFSP